MTRGTRDRGACGPTPPDRCEGHADARQAAAVRRILRAADRRGAGAGVLRRGLLVRRGGRVAAGALAGPAERLLRVPADVAPRPAAARLLPVPGPAATARPLLGPALPCLAGGRLAGAVLAPGNPRTVVLARRGGLGLRLVRVVPPRALRLR